MSERSSTIRRGALAGVIGAATLAVWFLLVDGIRGEPLQTPTFLAGAVFGGAVADVSALAVLLYSLLHIAVFVAVGIAAAWLVERLHVQPHFALGLVLGFLLFDILFYAGVVVTGVDVVRALGWPAVLAGNLLAGLGVFGYLHMTAATRPEWDAGLSRNRGLREGVIAGLIGAVVVAAWFLFLDLAEGRLFFTPAALGSALFLGAEGVSQVQVTLGTVAAYTFVHLAGFIAVGLLAAALVARAEREPPVILGAVLLFVTMEVFVIGMIAILATWLLDVVAWWAIGAANLVAALAMGVYLWREHPHLKQALGRQDLERPETARGRA